MKKERSLIFVGILVILLYAMLTPVSLQADNQTPSANNESILDATITSTVYVHNDAELQALAVDGTGTPVDPWIIRVLVIDTTDILGLRIDDTTEHFEILNCTITAGWGIYLDNIADSTARIKNNTVINCNSYGIYLNKANGTDMKNYTKACAVRKAMCYAIDRDEINQVIHDGEYIVNHQPMPIFSTTTYGVFPIQYKCDLDLAWKWMEAAGYERPEESISLFLPSCLSVIILIIIRKKQKN